MKNPDRNQEVDVSKWISVKDRMPLDMNDKSLSPYSTVNVITHDLHGAVYCQDYIIGSTGKPWGKFEDFHNGITHWKPLPEPPEIKRRK